MKTHDLQFVFIGNNLAVDFLNTEIVSRGELVELLQDNDDLVQWAHEAGLNLNHKLQQADLAAALALRQALKDVYQARIDHRPAPAKALATVNRHLANHATHQVLKYNQRNNEYQLVPAQDSLTLPVMLADLAYAGTKLLASPEAARLKRCSNSDCVLIFVDTSRGQKRRWCSMETCGNRAKVATHYRNSLSR